MEKGDKALVISTVLFTILVLVGVSQSILGYAVIENVAENATITESVSVGMYLQESILPRFTEIISSPFETPEMLWIAFPLLIVILFMQLYFGRWRNEKLGWASAFANWITLLFVSVNLFREMMVRYTLIASAPPSVVYILPAIPLGQKFIPLSVLYKFMLIFALFFVSILFMIVLFAHAIPKRASYIISSPLAVYTFAFIMIAIVYSDLPLDFPTFIAALLVYILILFIFKFIKSLVPPSDESKRYLLEQEKMRKRLLGVQKAVKTRKRHKFERKLINFWRRIHL